MISIHNFNNEINNSEDDYSALYINSTYNNNYNNNNYNNNNYNNNNYINNHWLNQNNYYFNNNANKIKECGKQLLNIFSNYFNFHINFRNTYETNMLTLCNNLDIFTDINTLFTTRGFSKDKIIMFLLFKLIAHNGDKNSMNTLYNELFDIRRQTEEFTNFKNNKINYIKNLNIIEEKCKTESQNLENIREEIKIIRSSIPTESKCAVCIDNIKSHIIVPCGHKSICEDCAPRILLDRTCPICRQGIQSIIKVYEV